MKSKDVTPLIMGCCLLAGIIVLAFIRPSRMTGVWNGYPLNFDTLFIGMYVLWMLVELRVSGKDVSTALQGIRPMRE